MIRLLYITKDPAVGAIAERAGVDWIFVDMEYRGKRERQANRDTVISAHSIEDVRAMRRAISKSKLLVRTNPIGPWSATEIEQVIRGGADIVMLPYFTTRSEVETFVDQVKGRAQTCLLLETLEAVENIENILAVHGVDYVHIGLNDIHIARKTTFLFEYLADGGVDGIAEKLRAVGMAFGFGGIARIGELIPPAEHILAEHIRLGSTGVILSRSFCQPSQANGTAAFEKQFRANVSELRRWEGVLSMQSPEYLERNRRLVVDEVNSVVMRLRDGR